VRTRNGHPVPSGGAVPPTATSFDGADDLLARLARERKALLHTDALIATFGCAAPARCSASPISGASWRRRRRTVYILASDFDTRRGGDPSMNCAGTAWQLSSGGGPQAHDFAYHCTRKIAPTCSCRISHLFPRLPLAARHRLITGGSQSKRTNCSHCRPRRLVHRH